MTSRVSCGPYGNGQALRAAWCVCPVHGVVRTSPLASVGAEPLTGIVINGRHFAMQAVSASRFAWTFRRRRWRGARSA